MGVCSSCGLQLSGDSQLCLHHHCVFGDDWAKGNSIWCAFFHRGIVPERLPKDERDSFWEDVGEAG